MVPKDIPPSVIKSRRPGLFATLLVAVTSATVVFASCTGPVTPIKGRATPWSGNFVSSGASAQFAPTEGQEAYQTGDPIGILGTVQRLPDGTGLQGAWKVNGLTVYATSNTQIDQQLGPASLGAEVELMGWLQSDGSMKAGWIRVLAPLRQANAESDAGAGIPRLGATAATPTSTPRPGITVPTAKPAAPGQEATGLQGSGTISATQSSQSWGNIERMLGADASGMWQIGGQDAQAVVQIQVGQQTNVSPIGGYGYVSGWALPDGTIQAADIDVTQPPLGQGGNSAYLQNTVQHRLMWHAMLQDLPQNSLQGVWVVGGIDVVVDGSTQIAGQQADIRPGAYVRVTGWLQDDGSIHAQKVELGEAVQFAVVVPSQTSGASRDAGAGSPVPVTNPSPSAAGGPQVVARDVPQGSGGDAPAPDQTQNSTQPDPPADQPGEDSQPSNAAQPTPAPLPPTAQPTQTPLPPTAQPTFVPLPLTGEPTPAPLLPTVQPTPTPLPPAAQPTAVPLQPTPVQLLPTIQPTSAPVPTVAVPRDVFAPPARAVPQPGFEPGKGVPKADPGNADSKAKDQGGQGAKAPGNANGKAKDQSAPVTKDPGNGEVKDQGVQVNKGQGDAPAKDQGNKDQGNGKAKDQGGQGNKDQGSSGGKAKGHK